MCNIEKQLEARIKMPAFYKHYVDDTLSTMPNEETASEFIMTLNHGHPSINYTMELEENGRLPFLGMEIIRNGCHLDTKVYRKPTDTGLLLHYHSHVDERYKRSLLNTMLNRAFKLSSTWKLFHQECERLKVIFSFSFFFLWDECAMSSACLFELYHTIVQGARKSLKPFGGLQTIIVGDWLQLQPVTDRFDKGIMMFKVLLRSKLDVTNEAKTCFLGLTRYGCTYVCHQN